MITEEIEQEELDMDLPGGAGRRTK